MAKTKGHRLSEETKKKISIALTGIKRSDDTKIKMSNSLSGSKHPRWMGGITPIKKMFRKSLEYRLWRKACFERDNFTCQKTGQIGGNLQVHHINNFADFPELRLAIDNGITLSYDAHKDFHRRYGIKNNTKEQLEEFLK